MINPLTNKDEVCSLCGVDGHFAIHHATEGQARCVVIEGEERCKLVYDHHPMRHSTMPLLEHKPEGEKYDKDKPRWDLIPFLALGSVVDVLTHGAKKYAPENWRRVEGWRWRYLGAALRHLSAYALGEKIDKESGLPHLAHAACCVLFMLELDQ